MLATEDAVFMAGCPVHGEMVALDRGERLLGRCSACMAEAALGIRMIERGEIGAQLLLGSEPGGFGEIRAGGRP